MGTEQRLGLVAMLAWLREHDPVHRSPYGYWLLTRYDDVAAAFRDPRLSSQWSKKGSLPGMAPRPAGAAVRHV